MEIVSTVVLNHLTISFSEVQNDLIDFNLWERVPLLDEELDVVICSARAALVHFHLDAIPN